MWVGCYCLDLYCENYTDTSQFTQDAAGRLVDAVGHEFRGYPRQYTAETGTECRSRARKAGWLLRRDGTALCPLCRKKAAPSGA